MMNRDSPKHQTLHSGISGSESTCNLIGIVRNISNVVNENKKKTLENRVLNIQKFYPVSPQSTQNCVETPIRTKRRRESEPFALDLGHTIPDSESSNSSDHIWEKSCLKKPRITSSRETEQTTFPQGKILTSAPRNNEEKNEPTCPQIQKPFRPNLQKHERTGENPNEYDQCDYVTSNLLRHVGTHTGEKPYKCGHCDYRTAYVSSLRRHERTHTGEKPYKCGQCDYRAGSTSNVLQHEKTHTAEKPYKCGQCDYRARSTSIVQQHERTHTAEKSYKCSHCDYRARQKGNIRQHERTHTAEKPYKCGQCDYRARQISNLQQHERTHTGEKPYKCGQCDYRARQSSNLRQHERTHMGEKQNERTDMRNN